MTNRAGFAPGEAREDWAILRALSDVLGKKLPFDSLPQLARQALCATTRISPASTRSRPATRGDIASGGEARRATEQGRVRVAGEGLLPDQPDRARLGRHGRMLGAGAQNGFRQAAE